MLSKSIPYLWIFTRIDTSSYFTPQALLLSIIMFTFIKSICSTLASSFDHTTSGSARQTTSLQGTQLVPVAEIADEVQPTDFYAGPESAPIRPYSADYDYECMQTMFEAAHSVEVLNIRHDLRLHVPIALPTLRSTPVSELTAVSPALPLSVGTLTKTSTPSLKFPSKLSVSSFKFPRKGSTPPFKPSKKLSVPSFDLIKKNISTPSLNFPKTFRLPKLPTSNPLSLARDFELLATLGAGTFGSVYLVQHLVTKKTFAVKVLDKFRSANPAITLRSARAEQTVLRDCNDSAGLVGLEASFHDSRNVYLLTRFCARGTLQDVLNIIGKPSPALVQYWCGQLARGLRDLHIAGWSNYDLKPANAFVDWNFNISIGDQGMADRYWAKGRGFRGTPGFAAPEMYTGWYDSKADVANLAAMFYYIATRKFLPDMYPVHIHPDLKGGPKFDPSDNVDVLLQDLISMMSHPNPAKRPTIDQVCRHVYWEQPLPNARSFLPLSDTTFKPLIASTITLSDIAGTPYKRLEEDPCEALNYTSPNFFEPLDANAIERQNRVLEHIIRPAPPQEIKIPVYNTNGAKGAKLVKMLRAPRIFGPQKVRPLEKGERMSIE